jgi:hypothetical protein
MHMGIDNSREDYLADGIIDFDRKRKVGGTLIFYRNDGIVGDQDILLPKIIGRIDSPTFYYFEHGSSGLSLFHRKPS